ncbi:MAG: TIGR04141 family sporadically distributed protein [Nocardioides alkalitolerans]
MTVYLMQAGVQEFSEARSDEKHAEEFELAAEHGIDGRFYRAPSVPRTPPWVGFIEPIVTGSLGDVRSSSASGLLLIRVEGRIFAFTFGFGRSLLDLSRIEHRFGLKVALNRVDPTQLRSLDTKAFEDLVVTTTTQVSKNAELPAFGVDVSRDILRAATGEPRDKSFAKRVSGSDGLVLNLETEAADLGALCEELLIAYAEDGYKADFEWIDQLMLVKDAKVLESLDEALVKELSGAGAVSTHTAVPEPINWEDIDAFKIAGAGRKEYDDLDLHAYLADLGDERSELTLERIKDRRVSVRYARSDRFESKWSLYKCLVSEQRVEEALYVLIEGRWFVVSGSLVEDVDLFVERIAEPTVTLPPSKAGEKEGVYNKRVAEESGGVLVSLDAKIKRPGGAASGIELCDLLSQDGEFIHVKRKSRSATLSHLFAQGSVSAATFFSDGTFRDEVRTTIDKFDDVDARAKWLELVPKGSDEVDRSRYCVTYAVVANSNRPGREWLPFFSKLNLMQHGRQLSAYGFRIALGRVGVDAEDGVAAVGGTTDE